MFIRFALILKNPEVATVVELGSEQWIKANRDSKIEGLQILSRRIAGSGMSPIAFLTCGQAGALIPPPAVKTAAHLQMVSSQIRKASGIDQKLPAGSILPFMNRATQSIRPATALFLGTISLGIVEDWIRGAQTGSKGPGWTTQFHWPTYDTYLPGMLTFQRASPSSRQQKALKVQYFPGSQNEQLCQFY